jgi:hypothetical protein
MDTSDFIVSEGRTHRPSDAEGEELLQEELIGPNLGYQVVGLAF